MITKNQLYDGEIELMFEPFRHQYRESGLVVPSVTTILSVINKPALISWAANTAIESVKAQIEPGKSYDEVQLHTILESSRLAHNKKKTDAGALGTFIHNWVEQHIKGENPGMPVNPNMQSAIFRFLEWEKKYNVKFLVSEQVIFSKKYRYTGTLDFICSIDGKMYIGDLKTSSGIYPEMFLQTAAYRYARTEEYPEEKYEGMLIIRVDKNLGDFEFAVCRNYDDYSKMMIGFVAALKLHNTMTALKGYRGERE